MVALFPPSLSTRVYWCALIRKTQSHETNIKVCFQFFFVTGKKVFRACKIVYFHRKKIEKKVFINHDVGVHIHILLEIVYLNKVFGLFFPTQYGKLVWKNHLNSRTEWGTKFGTFAINKLEKVKIVLFFCNHYL